LTQVSAISPRLLDEFTGIVSRAAAAVLAARASALAPRAKADLSPVTAADEASEAIILEGMARLLPGVPVVSEEAADGGYAGRRDGAFVLVDPVDGTRELLAGRDEFTVNIAMVVAGRPCLGIVAAPALGLIWRAREAGGAERIRLAPGAPASAARERTAIRTRALPRAGITVAVSRSHLDGLTEDMLAQLDRVERLVSGSAVKFCRVAEGVADLYPRLAPTREWDVAAGDAILSIAGGILTTPAGELLVYGTSADLIVPAFVAWGDRSARAKLGL
jgi:3'(2'), 5'-bisphosphate nucleotidase